MDETSTGVRDAALGRRLAGGDHAALGEIYTLYGALAWRVAFRTLRDRALAEDAVQDAFLQLWRQAHRFDARRAGLGAWLSVLAHRRAVDIARREARRTAGDVRATDLEPGTATTEEIVLLRYDRRRVREAIALLGDSQRELIELAYFGGLSQRELASRFALPLGTVKSRMFTALSRLAQALDAPVRSLDA